MGTTPPSTSRASSGSANSGASRGSGRRRPDWSAAAKILRQAFAEYCAIEGYKRSAARDRNHLGDYVFVGEKTQRRDMSGNHAIPHDRIKGYARWLREQVGRSRHQIADWLELTDYPHPGELLAVLFDVNGSYEDLYSSVRTNLPPLSDYLIGRFLPREKARDASIEWADTERLPIGVLLGFGGNGKTTVQLEMGHEFVHGPSAPLRYPYDGAVWVSADPNTSLTLADIFRTILETFIDDVESNFGKVAPSWLNPREELRRLPESALRERAVDDVLSKKRVLILINNWEMIAPRHQQEILEFFTYLRGKTQVLISSRYDPRLLIYNIGGDALQRISYVSIPVGGLSSEHVMEFIGDCLRARKSSPEGFTQSELQRLADVTHNNPKAIIAAVGVITGKHGKRIPLPDLLDAIEKGKPEANKVFAEVISEAWKAILNPQDQAVLMAKAFFSQPANPEKLRLVAGVTEPEFARALDILRIISFFEAPIPDDPRIRTHPLAQDFARSILGNRPDFEHEAEEHFWNEYAPGVVREAQYTAYKKLLDGHDNLRDEIMNVLDRMEVHLRFGAESPYAARAAQLFAYRNNLGYAMLRLGMWEPMQRVADIALEYAKSLPPSREKARLIGEICINVLGGLYRVLRQLDKAQDCVDEAFNENAILKDQWLEAVIKIGRAWILRHKGHFEGAKQLYDQVMRIYEVLRSSSATTTGTENHISDSEFANLLLLMGSVRIDLATTDMGSIAVDLDNRAAGAFAEAERFFHKSEELYRHVDEKDLQREIDRVEFLAYRGVIARVTGNLPRARALFSECENDFRDLLSLARLYRELALVEYLDGNMSEARLYDEMGSDIQKKMGVYERLPDHNCYLVIERLKASSEWPTHERMHATHPSQNIQANGNSNRNSYENGNGNVA
ncbi:MAG: hypothetical protein M3437_01680 [Chloroflexota bacterium]|nr:hypothetical protein [Chloroflexota bacterium]MDQ5867154.1 hypothetical protein [Chloroflexota bacterium]